MSILTNQLFTRDLIFHKIYKSQITKKALKTKTTSRRGKSDFGWIFTSKDCNTYKVCRSYETLMEQTKEQIYYTPNTFYRNDARTVDNLRWLNAIVIDIDVKNGNNTGLSVADLLDRVEDTGLNPPSMIVGTPSGGYHVYFILDTPRKAYTNAVKQYNMIQRKIAEAIDGDLFAIGAERVFRIPTPKNILFQSDYHVSFKELNDWYWINYADEAYKAYKAYMGFRTKGESILDHPAFKSILNGVEKGHRDCSAYTLALAYKFEGFDMQEAEELLLQWNKNLNESLPDRDIHRKIKSAYKIGSKLRPSSEAVESITGIAFSYRTFWEPAKAREQRKNSHFEEWATDILKLLNESPDYSISGSQRKLSASMGMSLSSFQHVIGLLLTNEKITVEVEGKGRNARTIISLKEESPNQEKEIDLSSTQNQIFNVPNSNTNNLDTVVGGPAFFFLGFSYCRIFLPDRGGGFS